MVQNSENSGYRDVAPGASQHSGNASDWHSRGTGSNSGPKPAVLTESFRDFLQFFHANDVTVI